jgi:hypothetical protein
MASLPVAPVTAVKKVRKAVDWDAIERDYRLDKFTLRELAEKHSVTHTTIARRAEKSQWTKDLAKAVRDATSQKLIQDATQQECNTAHQSATEAVLAAADVNVRVITGHRKRLTDLYALADSAQEKLETLGLALTDVREAAVFVQAVGNLTTMTKTLITEERRAFGLDDEEQKKQASYEDLLLSLGGQ